MIRPCSVLGCTRLTGIQGAAKGYCMCHYKHWRLYGVATHPSRRGLKGTRSKPWSEAEMSLLMAILDRAEDGLETARYRELVNISDLTGRTVGACETRLWQVREKRLLA